jgi:hypothetical protein
VGHGRANSAAGGSGDDARDARYDSCGAWYAGCGSSSASGNPGGARRRTGCARSSSTGRTSRWHGSSSAAVHATIKSVATGRRRSGMPRFLIEVPHEANTLACARVVHVFLTSGSHFLTNAEWGCADGDHRAWMIVDVGTKAEALAIVPPAFRGQTRVTGLNRFEIEYIDKILATHGGSADDRTGPTQRN